VSQQLNPVLPDLWGQRVDEMDLRVETSPLWPLVQKLYEELATKGIDFRPPLFVANEWGCPDGQPLIGVPFYLVDARLHEMEEEYADDLEDAARILMGLRHEAGHAINYAYQLYTDPEWDALFGSFHREYADDYRPEPFTQRCVRHLPAWYAQKHPDEDFAETFAVWMTPGLDWRAKYAGWEALRKLEYVERVMARIGAMEPLVSPASCTPDPDELAFTVGEFYQNRTLLDAPPVDEIGGSLDEDLRELFSAEGIGTDAAALIHDRRKQIMRSVSHFSGSRMYVVKSLIGTIVQRVRTLGLRAAPGREIDAVIGATSMIATLTRKFVETGHFL
jgi:hypothetical protein